MHLTAKLIFMFISELLLKFGAIPSEAIDNHLTEPTCYKDQENLRIMSSPGTESTEEAADHSKLPESHVDPKSTSAYRLTCFQRYFDDNVALQFDCSFMQPNFRFVPPQQFVSFSFVCIKAQHTVGSFKNLDRDA